MVFYILLSYFFICPLLSVMACNPWNPRCEDNAWGDICTEEPEDKEDAQCPCCPLSEENQ